MMNAADYLVQGKIYKYTSVESTLAILKNTSLKFSCPLDFNDPFDSNMSILQFSKTQSSIDEIGEALKLASWTRADRRTHLRKLNDPGFFNRLYKHVVKQKIQNSKVTCFSRTYTNTLMWSHYADQHKGICIEFNGSTEPKEILERQAATILNVNYDRTDMINYNKEKVAAVVDLFTRKSSDWKYEEEVRIIVMDNSQYHKFNKPFLTGVIFGCRTSDADKEAVLNAVKAGDYNLDLQQAKKGKFQLKFEPVIN